MDLWLRLDVTLGYRRSAGLLGAHGGLELSATTFVLGALYLAWGWEWLVHGPSTRPRIVARWWAPVLVYAAAVALSVSAAADRFLALSWLLLLTEALLLYVYLLHALRDPAELRFLLQCLCWGLALAGSVIVLQVVTGASHLLGLPLVVWPGPDGAVRAAGTFGSPNSAATYFSILVPLSAGTLLSRRDPALRLAAAAGFGAGVLGLAATVSRGGLLSMAVGLAVVFVVAVRRGWMTHRAVAVVALVVALAAAAFGPLLAARIVDDQGGRAGRGPLSALAVDMARTRPLLGVGPDNFAVALPDHLTPDFSLDWI